MKRLIFVPLALTLVLVLMAGCGPKQPKVVPPEPVSNVQTIPGYVAVVAEPGDTLAGLAQQHLGDAGKAWIIARFNGIEEATPGQTVIVPTRPVYLGGIFASGYQTVPILSYHRVHLSKSDKMTVTVANFEAQMQYLRDNGYTVVGLDAFYDFLEFKAPLPYKSVVITFDDGWSSFAELAWPILERFGYPATLFVYTQIITGTSATLSWEQVNDLVARGADIQCHTVTHRDMSTPTASENLETYYQALEKEILLSAKTIEDKAGVKVDYLAYPYGKSNDLVTALLRKNGFRGGLTVHRNSNPFFQDAFRIGRRMIYGEFDLNRFAQELECFTQEALQ